MRTLTVLTLLTVVFGAPAIAEEVTITGRVVGPDGEAVPGATVGIVTYFEPPFEWVNTTSADDGSFEFTLDTSPPREMTFVAAAAEGLGATGTMTTALGQPVEVRFSDASGSLSGTVRDVEGAPLNGARVSVLMLQREGAPGEVGGWFIDWEHAPAALTDADGRFTIERLPTGMRAALSVEAEGFATWRDTHPEQWHVVGEDTAAEVALEPGGMIAGRVTHEGEPAAGVYVRAMGQMDFRISWGQVVTDEQGHYEIGNIGGGVFAVGVRPLQDLVAAPHYGVEVAAGERVEGVDLELTTGALVRGRVVWGDSGEPVVGATVGVFSEMAMGARAQTGEDGSYELRLPPGEHRVQWMRGMEGDARGSEPGSHQIEVVIDETREGVDFALQRKRMIALTVLGPDGRPSAGASVLWEADGHYRPGGPEAATTDENGRAEVLFGREVHEWDTAEAAALAQDVEAGLAGMTVVDGETDTEAVIRLAEGAWALVTAQTREGEPVGGVEFRVLYEVGNSIRDLPLRASTGEDGRARIGPLPAGVGLSIGPAWEWSRRTLEPRYAGVQSIVFEPGETREFGPYLVAPDGARIRGTVIDAQGEPVEGALLFCADSFDGRPIETETDGAGRFELTGIAVSEETVVVIAATPDGSAAWAEFVDPAVAYEPTVELSAPGTIVATFVGADGRPVPDVEVRISGQRVRAPSSLPGGLTTQVQELLTDEDGRVRIERLVPGVEYLLSWQTNPERNEWTLGDLIAIYGDGEVVEVRRSLAE
ncbi:MAG: carboxypeptidase regulatory-like domain-containing protein [Armatimonadota bacterium]|jgi:protocatechuate 3,4-dioxygenase beta subunit